jgi:uncharacterized membrane protein
MRRQFAGPQDVRRGERGEGFRLAFGEFVLGSGGVVIGVLLFGAFAYFLDRAQPAWLSGTRQWLQSTFFQDGDATGQLLQSISTTVITVASITFSLMLVAIQQSASSMTAQVFGQFLRRRNNQFYFGFFVGLGAYALLASTTAHQGFNPVYGAALTVVMSVVAVLLLLALVYSSVNQMRPVVIVESIHDHLIESRFRQLTAVVARTRRECRLGSAHTWPVISDLTGFVMRINLDRIQRAIDVAPTKCEVELCVSIGSYVAYGDRLAIVRSETDQPLNGVSRAIERSIRRERQRNIDDIDAAFGLDQLETIGWTSTSGAQHNPQAARLVVGSLRDILARLAVEAEQRDDEPDTDIVYHDGFPETLMQTLESLAVITAESQQHQVATDIIDAVDSLLPRMTPAYRERSVDLLMRTLPALASHPPTLRLETAMRCLRDTLEDIGAHDTASVVDDGVSKLRHRIGTVESEYTPR